MVRKITLIDRSYKDNEGKIYQQYNPDHNPEATFTTFGRKEVLSHTESNKLKDKLNKILHRKPADGYKKYI